MEVKMIIYNKKTVKILFFVCLFSITSVFQSGVAFAQKTQIVFSTTVVDIAVDLNRDGKVEFAQWEYTEGEQYEGCAEIDNNRTPTDKTTPLRPYLFWLNNDLDLVNHNGSSDNDFRSCDGQPTDSSGNQICEVWDEDPLEGIKTNTSVEYIDNIENIRDLEDFTPLAIMVNKHTMNRLKSGELQLLLSAKGVSVKLFKSTWSDLGNNRAHGYITDKSIALAQVTEANTSIQNIEALTSGGSAVLITKDYISRNEKNGVLKFIFEGVSASAGCELSSAECYVQVKVVETANNDVVLAESKVYLDLHDIKDFYELATAGTAQNGNSNLNFEAEYDGSPIVTVDAEQLAIFDCVAKNEIINRTRAVQIHGWRMRDDEKLNFAETSFKRLYWSGYQGRFSTMTWPTGWHVKPAHVYSILGQIGFLLGNQQNYDNSESIARKVGEKLALWLLGKRKDNEEVYVIAHSMGNIVVSEALKQSLVGLLIDGYAATNAATAAGAYDSNAINLNIEKNWRTFNLIADSEPDNDYDMPPDVYRFDLTDSNDQLRYGPTTDEATTALIDQGYLSYYQNISAKANGRIVNFYNPADAALAGWQINQITKPDFADGDTWVYLNKNKCPNIDRLNLNVFFSKDNCLPGSGSAIDNPVTSRFFSWNEKNAGREFIWGSLNDRADIMAHIIPARTKALGQDAIAGEMADNLDLGLTKSNQDHSAVFHGYFGATDKNRKAYWSSVLSEVFDFELRSSDYSGLVR